MPIGSYSKHCDFWTPATWREFLLPAMSAEAALAHEHGAKFGCFITSKCMSLLDLFAEAGVDILIGVDPKEWDMAEAKRRLQGRVCLWGGVSGHLTMEQGTEEEVREAVDRAMEILAPGGGFILSPVDNDVREDTPRSRANVRVLVDEWRRS